MTALDDDPADRPSGLSDDRAYNARVTDPPQGATGTYVTIPALGEYKHGPCRLQPVVGEPPVVGDRCLVVRGDGQEEWWIVQFDDRDVTPTDFAAADAALAAADVALDARLDVIEGQSKIAFPFGANWGNFGGTFEDATYSKHAKAVRLQGLVTKTGTPGANDVIGTLPAGFRPTEDLMFVVITGGGTPNVGRVDVQADGDVVWITGNTTETDYTSLSGISFVID